MTTRIVQFAAYGPPEVLEVAQTPTPVPGPGELLVSVRAAGVQPFDCATRRGDFRQWRPIELPARLGNEIAGIVTGVGPGVTTPIGQEVLGYLDLRGYASDVVIAESDTVHKPVEMSWAEAGGISVSGQTACTALDALSVTAEDTILIHAAAGGVGSLAVQLAVIRGATVIGTASQANHDYLRTLGAVPVTYGPGLADRVRALAPGGITKVLDAIGGEALDVSVDLLKDVDNIVTIADWARSAELGIRRVGTERSKDKLADLVGWYAKGQISVAIASEYSFEDAAQAHADVETGHVRGKVVLVP